MKILPQLGFKGNYFKEVQDMRGQNLRENVILVRLLLLGMNYSIESADQKYALPIPLEVFLRTGVTTKGNICPGRLRLSNHFILHFQVCRIRRHNSFVSQQNTGTPHILTYLFPKKGS